MFRTSKMTDDERVLLDCSDDDIAVVCMANAEEDTNGNSSEEENLDEALALNKPVIAIKQKDLARDTAWWLKTGRFCRQATIGVAVGSLVCTITFISRRLAKTLAITSLLFSAAYYSVWHWDAIYTRYHVLENPRLLIVLGSRYRRGTNVVLVRNLHRENLWIPAVTSTMSFFVAYGHLLVSCMRSD